MKKSLIQKVNCPRCQKEVYTLSFSAYGLDGLKRKYQGVCSDCITPEESKEIMETQAEAILKRARMGE